MLQNSSTGTWHCAAGIQSGPAKSTLCTAEDFVSPADQVPDAAALETEVRFGIDRRTVVASRAAGTLVASALDAGALDASTLEQFHRETKSFQPQGDFLVDEGVEFLRGTHLAIAGR